MGTIWWISGAHTQALLTLLSSLSVTIAQTTRTTRTPAFWGYPPPPHDYPYHWVILDPKSKEDKVKVTNLKNSPKFKMFVFWNGHYTWHTFLSCLIRCANMKWIRWVLLKIQSGHDSVHRRTDGRTDRRTRWYQYTPYQLRGSGGYKNGRITDEHCRVAPCKQSRELHVGMGSLSMGVPLIWSRILKFA